MYRVKKERGWIIGETRIGYRGCTIPVAQIAKKLKITPILDKLLEYKRNWIQHVNYWNTRETGYNM